MKELLILSGKGGTGKTTIASAFIKLSKAGKYSDCDVDAPNLHLLANWDNEPNTSDYYGMGKAWIDTGKCIGCDLCRKNCRFDAISVGEKYTVNQFACEACGVCEYVCSVGAVSIKSYIDGELMLYSNDKETFSTAQLKIGSGTSGLLVTEVKKQMREVPKDTKISIIDGSPGIGCPVIASLSGVDMVLIVAEPSVSGISDMERILKTAKRFNTKTAVCVNKFDTNIQKAKQIKSYCSDKSIDFVGMIPFDSNAVKAINSGKTIIDIDCESGESVKEIFKNTIDLLL